MAERLNCHQCSQPMDSHRCQNSYCAARNKPVRVKVDLGAGYEEEPVATVIRREKDGRYRVRFDGPGWAEDLIADQLRVVPS